jgi:DNA-directed RNA polymerase subunit M/transcription elongation factor TFIIS
MSTQQDMPDLRAISRETFIDLLRKHASAHDISTTSVVLKYAARDLEQGCFIKTIEHCLKHDIEIFWDAPKFVYFYSYWSNHLVANLDPDSCVKSDYLMSRLFVSIKEHLKDVESKKTEKPAWDLRKYAALPSHEMVPIRTEAIRQSIAARLNQVIVQKTTDLYVCGKCKQRKTTTYEQQTRCADEAPTTFVTCVNCHHRWRA